MMTEQDRAPGRSWIKPRYLYALIGLCLGFAIGGLIGWLL